MPDHEPPAPRKKPKLIWWLLGAIMLLLFLFCLQLFGPNAPIVVSKKTTYLTTPLRADGLPDYERYVLDRLREGVTPENNAAVLIWEALASVRSDINDDPNALAELGVPPKFPDGKPLPKVYDKELEQSLSKWWRDKHPADNSQ